MSNDWLQAGETGSAPSPWYSLCIKEDKQKNRRKQIHVEKSIANIAQSQQMQDTSLPTRHIARLPDRADSSAHHAITAPESNITMTTPPATSLLQIDATVIGMDFVLTLESPCLSHIDIAHSESNRTSTGHALMASASILHQNHNPPGERLNSETSWQVPGLGLERLLELSESIVLDECELTPVQAWDYIRRHPQFAELETERLEVLKEKLVRQIKCYGFGGVIDRNVLEDAVFETFVVGRVF